MKTLTKKKGKKKKGCIKWIERSMDSRKHYPSQETKVLHIS